MKKSILIVLALLLVNMAMAQMKVTGTITSSEDGSPIPYATILVKGVRGAGAVTDLDGKYSIDNVQADAILQFSYIGFTTQEIPVNGRAVINVVMAPDATSLDEVMVVAYGTATKGTFTGAASVVKNDAIKDVPNLSFESALSGKVAGMQITTLSGQAGSTSSIRIRGIGSMNASNEPLYVVDGVPVVSGSAGQMSGQIYSTSNVMSTINPADIESITVLKDAAASSLYGSRAANGVVMITTKRGKQGKPVINFKASLGITPDWATENYDAATTEQQIEMYYENFWNAGVYYQNKTVAAASTEAIRQLNNRFNKHGYIFSAPDNTVNSLTVTGDRAGQYYDWESQLFRTAVYQTYDLSVSGATDVSNYYTSLSYSKEQGRITLNDFDRVTGRINMTQKVGKFVEFTTNVNVAKSSKKGYNDTRALGNNYFLQSRNLMWGMYWPTNYQTGEPWTIRYGSYAYNPLYYDNEWDNNSTTLRISANEAITLKLLPELTVKSIISFDNAQTLDHLYYSPIHFSGSSAKGIVREMSTNVNKLVSSSTINYNKTFAQKHTLGLLAGWEAEKNNTDYQRAEGSDLPTGALQTVATAGVLTASAYNWGNTMMSLLSRVEYNYDNKYYVSGSFRRDGSSRLGPAVRWGNFWSLAGSWRIDREEFMKNIDFISSLRLRGSYGVNGTLPSSNFGWRSLATYGNKYMEQPGGGVSTIADANLSWETSYTSNLALEFGILDQRITGTVEVFNRDSKDLLQDVPISRVTGFSSTLKNIGEINNKGIEIELSGEIIKGKEVSWNAGITASHITSKVTKLYGGQNIIWFEPTGGDSRIKFMYQEGQSTLAVYGREWAGVDRETGKNVWYMNNENTTSQPTTVNGRPATFRYQDASEKILGDIHPKLFGGFNTDVNWKGFTLALNFTYKLGGYTYDAAGRDVIDDGYYWERIMSKYQYENRWTPENKDAKLPQRVAVDFEDVNQKSSRHMYKADYLRLKTVTLGYNIPKNIVNKINVSSARVFFNGMNLWTLAAHKVYDPEVNEYGSRGWETPIGKTYTFGVELSF
ncbi:MAG: SusC/RagA family TonB-linked outer membrane protein [Bacteroidetes bacterium GWE2_39_28]|nr:MAG: SusC/RagA family TonB-linked outer membrane protein [Bacteroidetes bacterium GWE2_39_28]OFY14668.1 MAG: SusC/RagA family TonB-linked outer membrane protein [Bacteroidetes bacterium GWF2_39_10]OFZ12278.1 MAG: SusC/RagA family TonB-linked outer membrane protein [Bacteroidetes bacterium RIFOXYC2_FULL_39_11]HCT94276.1 TonB-dependent receptor [Rikenellaceae bacterium]